MSPTGTWRASEPPPRLLDAADLVWRRWATSSRRRSPHLIVRGARRRGHPSDRHRGHLGVGRALGASWMNEAAERERHRTRVSEEFAALAPRLGVREADGAIPLVRADRALADAADDRVNGAAVLDFVA